MRPNNDDLSTTGYVDGIAIPAPQPADPAGRQSFDYETFQTTCPGCQEPCEAVMWGKVPKYLCMACAASDKARRSHLERRRECLALWGKVTPEEFQEPIERALIPSAFLPILGMSGTEGVGLIGPSGMCKTRIAYGLLKKAAAAGLKVFAITQSLLRQAAADKHSDDRDAAACARQRLHAARFAQCLLLDDIGKGAATDTGSEALYELLTHRRDSRLVTHWTANHDGKWIAARYGADRGPAIAIRLAHLAGCRSPGTGRIYTASNPSANT